MGLSVVAGVAHGQTSKPVLDLTVSQLIDRLQEVSDQEYQVPTNIIAIEGPMPQGLRMMQAAPPKPAEVMEELVRRGAGSLPGLCAHLDDPRKTKATIHGMQGALTYSAEYDWNPRSGAPRPIGVVANFEEAFDKNWRSTIPINGAPAGDAYTLAIGDLCFELIGQIVDRGFEAGRYQPSGIVIVNSPVLCPNLARAVRLEWQGLTPVRHRELLVQDVSQPDTPGRAQSGVAILRRYYPDAVPAAVRQRLRLPVYDESEVRTFVEQSLLTDPEASTRAVKIKDFLAAHGRGCRDGIVEYLWGFRDTALQRDWKVLPATVLGQLTDKIDPDYPPASAATDIVSNSLFVESLKGMESAEIDDAVFEQFIEHSRRDSSDWTSDDILAATCIGRLIHRGHDPVFVEYCRRRLNKLQNDYGVQQCYSMLKALTPAVGAATRP